MKRVSVLGATGSIGQNTIDLLARRPGDFRVVALTGGRNLERLAEDAKRIIGYKTSEIEALLGYRGRDEMIHRDDLVLG